MAVDTVRKKNMAVDTVRKKNMAVDTDIIRSQLAAIETDIIRSQLAAVAAAKSEAAAVAAAKSEAAAWEAAHAVEFAVNEAKKARREYVAALRPEIEEAVKQALSLAISRAQRDYGWWKFWRLFR